MIVSFKDRATEDFYHGLRTTLARRLLPAHLVRVAQRKLDMLDAAHRLSDLRVPPGNRLEKLKGDLEGMYSIRVNDQFRIIFQWTDEGPEEVQIVDYH